MYMRRLTASDFVLKPFICLVRKMLPGYKDKKLMRLIIDKKLCYIKETVMLKFHSKNKNRIDFREICLQYQILFFSLSDTGSKATTEMYDK